MIKLYLITGFLGAGKTTTLKRLIVEWQNQKLAVIVNEFGKEGIDGTLISQTGVMTEEISNGSIFCSCKLDKFVDVLKSIIEKCPDSIIVEASGLSDPTHIKKILDTLGLKEKVEFAGSICLIDAHNFHRVIDTARVSKKQVKVSDIAIINKIDLVNQMRIEEIEKKLKELNPYLTIYHTSFGQLEQEWFFNLKEKALEEKQKDIHTRDIGLQKYLLNIKGNMTYKECVSFIELFIEETYRIKGFVKLVGKLHLVDCVGMDISISPYEGEVKNENQLVVLSGAHMPIYKSLKKASEWYCKYNIEIQE